MTRCFLKRKLREMEAELLNARQAAKLAAKRIEELEDYNRRCANDIKAYNRVIEEMIQGKPPCAWCMERADCEDQTHGCDNWVLDIDHGEQGILSEGGDPDGGDGKGCGHPECDQ